MTAALSRRRALLGSAAAAIGIGVPVVAMAAAPAVPPVSVEAKALQAELARLSSAYRRACREADEACEATAEVEPPEVLYTRPGDANALWGRIPVKSWAQEGRHWYADETLIEKLRADPFRYLDGSPSPGAARRDEVVAAWDGWRADKAAAEEASGYTAAHERFEAAYDAYEAFRLRLVDLRTDDPEVLTVKALAIADLCRGAAPPLDNSIAQALRRDQGAFRDALALSLARDFLELLGADHREAARG